MLAKSVVSLVIASAGLIGLPSSAADSSANKPRNLASACAMCHGTNGVSMGGVPSISGRSREYLEIQLRDFRAGRRPATIMQQIAKGYTDSELATLATHFAAQDSGNARVPASAGKKP
jgi:cytochrome c553